MIYNSISLTPSMRTGMYKKSLLSILGIFVMFAVTVYFMWSGFKMTPHNIAVVSMLAVAELVLTINLVRYSIVMSLIARDASSVLIGVYNTKEAEALASTFPDKVVHFRSIGTNGSASIIRGGGITLIVSHTF